jgi:phosphate starvation-inducible PhoH-like protein
MKVKKITKIEDKETPYFSVNVKDNHNYFASHGLLSKNCLMLLDEAQNCDMKQLMLYTSRLGKESKMVIAGDVTQHDIAYEKVALPDYINMIKDVKGVSEVVFTEEDIVRSDILKEIVKRYEEWKYRDMKPIVKKSSPN